MSESKTHILLFDGVCNLCNSSVNFIIKRDKNINFNFAALQSEIAQDLLKKYDFKLKNLDSIILIKEGKYYLESSAVLHIVKKLDGAWKLFYVFIIIPKPIRDFIYKIIARNRYKIFGKKNKCLIPTPEIKDRFLSKEHP